MQTGTFLTITLIIFELRGREAVNMVVLLHVSHFCCLLFYDNSPYRLMSSQDKGALTIMGRGSKGLCSQNRRKETSTGKNCQESWGRERRGRGREIFPLHFFSYVFFSSSHSPLYSTYTYI